MATNTTTSLSSDLQRYYSNKLRYQPGAARPDSVDITTPSHSPWQPIQYTSMLGWFVLNYTLLVLLMVLPATLTYAIWSLAT